MKNLIKIAGLLLIISLSGCLNDSVVEPLKGDLNSTAELLRYFEEIGDYPNSPLAPALVSADELFNNLTGYLVIDIRSSDSFASGHIANSINIKPDSLLAFLQSADLTQYSKIVLVDLDGQASAYYTCLLRLTGMDNVFSLNFGLASWNSFFADNWNAALGVDPEIAYYTNDDFPKDDYTELPEIIFDNPNASIEIRAEERINKIINEGVLPDLVYRISMFTLPNDYLLCYAPTQRAYDAPRFVPLGELGHPPSAKFYRADDLYELRSAKELQTLPRDKKIYVYDINGQLAASICAYLRVLGYDACFLIYGAHKLFYPRVLNDEELLPYAFTAQTPGVYPYQTN